MSYAVPKLYVLLNSTVASSSASISFTSLITSNFSTYYLRLRDVIPANNADALLMTFSTDNGANYLATNYQWSNMFQISSNLTGINVSNSDTSGAIALVMRSSATPGMNADIYLFNMNSGTYNPSYLGNVVQSNDSNGNLGLGSFSGRNTTTTAVTAIKLVSSTGNIASGTFNFYGVNEP